MKKHKQNHPATAICSLNRHCYQIICKALAPNEDKRIRVIITGATGMVGEGVLHECLQHPLVEAILVINNRKPCGIAHSKLKEIIHSDFFLIFPASRTGLAVTTPVFSVWEFLLRRNEG